ncbi:hypothetical protein Mal4_37560 [Maioricimonas rarisocia]|uniref:Uncharacterized protein n=1 Tax=Maioricimonas rarisocia TaxID=2528026 RepID=A0A517ZAD8_9PLAN|nr:hypothetical protein [Maioricimonas rarisocia]QDU39411.1 hypothetical protein Mal4_37560 [Maioricimonas rarisocia]
MMMIAALGVIIPLNIGVGVLGNNQFAVWFNLTTMITWFIVASFATALVAARCTKNILRYGVFGFARPNWWFEFGRLSVIVGLFAVISCPAAFFLPFRNSVVPALLATAAASAVLFVVAATVGYVLAFVNHSPVNSKAFQCVHYFYCTMVPVTLLITSAICWPQAVFWPNGFLVICGGVASAILCACGMLSVVSRYNQWETEEAS